MVSEFSKTQMHMDICINHNVWNGVREDLTLLISRKVQRIRYPINNLLSLAIKHELREVLYGKR